MSCNKLENFVNINCCNQMGERSKFIEIIQSLEALVEEAYLEGWYDSLDPYEDEDYKHSIVKKQLDELKQEVI